MRFENKVRTKAPNRVRLRKPRRKTRNSMAISNADNNEGTDEMLPTEIIFTGNS